MTVSQVIDKIDTKLQRLPPPVCGIKELVYVKVNTVPSYRESEPKMTVAQTGNTYISAACRPPLDRNTIPNPKPMFSTLGFSIEGHEWRGSKRKYDQK